MHIIVYELCDICSQDKKYTQKLSGCRFKIHRKAHKVPPNHPPPPPPSKSINKPLHECFQQYQRKYWKLVLIERMPSSHQNLKFIYNS